MMKSFHKRPNNIAVLLPVALLIASLNWLVNLFLPSVSWEALTLHSTIEALGSLSILAMAAFLLMIQRGRNDLARHVWTATGSIGMGLLDAFHAAVLPGHGFVWLHSTATLAGGLLFALVWLPDRLACTRWARALPWVTAIAAVIFGTLSVALRPMFPVMVVEGEFTITAKVINLLGGFFFLTAMMRFSLRHQADQNGDDLLFACLCLLFGAAGLLFSLSAIWMPDWWLWHFVRLLASFIALGYMLRIFLRAETEYRTIIQTSLDGFYINDSSGRFLEVNEACCQILGYTRKELLNLNISDLETAATQEETTAHIEKIMRTGGDRFITRHRRKDGALVDVEVSTRYVAASGERLFAFLRDITLKRQTETKLFERGQELLFRNRIAEIFLTRSHKHIFAETLKVVLEATGSRYGIFGYLDGEGSLVVPSMTQEIWDQCRIFSKAHVFPKSTWSDSSWPRAIREKKTIYANEPACQTPQGHIAITRHISVPIIFQDKVIGLFQVANKKNDYSAADIRTLEALTGYIAPLLEARLERERAEDLITNVLESIDEGFIIINRNFEIISSNRAYAENVGSPLGEIVGQHCYKISHHIDQPCYLNGEDCAVKHVFDTGEAHTALHTHYDTENHPIYVETKAFALSKNDLGEAQTAIEIVVDITEKKNREDEIHRLAFYDPLTRLPNRRLLLDRLEQAFIASDRNGQYGAVLFLDLDHFKTLNDTRGHETGDLLLIEVAGRLQTVVREVDTVSRQGGDEFVVLLKNLSTEKEAAVTQAGYVAEKIRAGLDLPLDLAGHEQQVTVSIGISLFLGHDTQVEEIFKRADTAMYQAKNAGRNCVRFFDPAMQATLEAASKLTTDLRQAISERQFALHYQPQTDGDGRIIGAEALLRWTHPDRGMVPPSTFIQVAEETGLILPIGRWVLEEACDRLAAWADIPAACGLRLAVNVSARQFRQPDFVAEVRKVLKASGADPARLKLELTESLVLADMADTVAKMEKLKAMGIGFSMDDFGTGYSSLSQLKRLPLEQLKIDQSFVHDLGIGPHDAAIVQTIIAMGRTMGLHVIAEGVETEAQLNFLIQSGCNAYQGFLFSQPVPAADFERMLVAGVIARKP